MRKTRPRLDCLLVEQGLFPTRAKAQAAVMAGQVLVEGKPALKSGLATDPRAKIELLSPCPYVSRGGLKLAAALETFPVQVQDRACLDLGASTGGFTDCLLQRGASKVYAVDVGRGQLDSRLRQDPRVVSLERTHARDLKPDLFEPRPDFAVIDVSFISLTSVLPQALKCLKTPCEILALIKPQFELEARLVPKGVVKNPESRLEAIRKVRESLSHLPVYEQGLFECPVRGPKGNVEFFLYFKSAIV
jgi:23S rRNA (cytidine1920-2'-O)/16S rRNA (cytidine1409-2'-O)-methyltransferase